MIVNQNQSRNQGQRFNLVSQNDRAHQPEKIITPLLMHQKTALHELICLEQMEQVQVEQLCNCRFKTNMGFLADKPGSGKSLMILALCATGHTITGCWNPQYEALHMLGNITVNTNIIIVPANVLHQWQQYLDRHTQLEYRVISNQFETDDLSSYDRQVTLVNADVAKRVLALSIDVKRIIIDEVDTLDLNICNTDINMTSSFMWLVTATPDRLLNALPSSRKLQHLSQWQHVKGSTKVLDYVFFPKSLFLCFPKYLIKFIIVRNNDEFVEQSLNLPNPIINTVDCIPPKYMKLALEITELTSQIQRYLAAHDLAGISRLLNCNITKPVDFFNVFTRKWHSAITERKYRIQYITSLSSEQYDNAYGNTSNFETREVLITHLEQEITSYQNKIDSLHDRLEELTTDACSVCYTEFDMNGEAPVVSHCCQHALCPTCVALLVNERRNCAFCRANNPEYTVLSDYQHPESRVQDNQPVNKIETIIRLITQNPDGKFLIFASNDGSFREIVEQLERLSLCHHILRRDSDQVAQQIQEFDSGTVRIMLLNATQHGAGLNLQSATDVIITHKLDAYTYEQVLGRAQRLGRTQALRVHKLAYAGEYC